MPFDPTAYGPIFAQLLQEPRLAPLGPGRPNVAVRPTLDALTVEAAFPQPVRNKDMAAACLVGVWLYHDFLDASHEISQGIATPTGSYWHGLMHRREGDFSNAKYWFRRVGAHPVFAALAPAAAALPDLAARLRNLQTTPPAWDPFAFIDLCEARVAEAACREAQQREWELLFDYCYHAALTP